MIFPVVIWLISGSAEIQTKSNSKYHDLKHLCCIPDVHLGDTS